MPVINGVYTKDFPALGRAPIDTDIIPIAEVANQITYKTTIGAIFNAKVFGTTGRLSKFTTANTLGNSILNEIGNAIHLTNAGSSFASFGIINPGTPGDPGVDNDGYIGSTINNDFTIRVNNTEAARFDTALRFKIANIQNATTDTDKFLVSDGGIVKYRTGTELRSDIGAGVGSVTSVGLTMPVAFSVANSPITSSGSLDVTAVGTASQYIRGDGQLATLPTGAGGGSAVNYYLNGSIAASVATYKQMSTSAVIGGGTDFNLVGNGLIAQFLTDVGNPNRLLIPGGAWNFEMFFSVSSAGGNQKFYIELLKYDGTTFSLIASSSTNPEEITGGTTTDLYLTSLAVPETVLLTTDRLAVRVYIVDNSGGRTVTLHTEDNNLCLVTTTFAGGISALNGLTANTQYFAVGTTGTDFNISSVTDTHTFNLPTASATNRGALSSANWTTFNNKQDALSGTGIVKSTAGVISYLTDPLPIANGGTGSATQNFVDLTNNQTIAGTKTFTTASRTIFTNADFFQVEFSNGSSKLNLGSVSGESYIYSSGDLRFGTNYPSDSLSSPKLIIATSGLVTITNQLRLNSTITNGTYTYTLPSATGTLALTSALSGYLPLSGGTLTGALNGTSATFSGNLTFTAGFNQSIGWGGNTSSSAANPLIYSNDSYLALNSKAGSALYLNFDNTNSASTINMFNGKFILTQAGAATFSSSVSATTIDLTSDSTEQFKIKTLTDTNRQLLIGYKYTENHGYIQALQQGVGYKNLILNGLGGNVGIGTITPGTSPNNTLLGFANGSNIQARIAVPQLALSSNIDGDWYDATYKSNGYAAQIVIDPANMSGLGNGISFNIASSGTAGNPITWSRALTVNASGNVLIGTTTSDAKLRVSGVYNGTQAIFGVVDGRGLEIATSFTSGTNDAGTVLNARGAGAGTMIFQNDSSEKMRITSGGNVLIGTTTDAGYKLDINGTGRFSQQITAITGNGNVLEFGASGQPVITLFQNSTSYGYYNNTSGVNNLLINNSTGAATFSSSVTATAFFESSDSRLKTLITDNHQAKGIESITAKLYTKNGVEELGYFAQDVQSVLPSAVIERDDTYLDLSYRQVHTAKIANLENRIKQLEDLIKQLI
jgi:hypothetical protein